jgi:Ca2+-transporting ATPase
VLELLGSGPGGLSRAEARARLAAVGPNEAAPGKTISPLRLLARQFTNVLIVILLAAALLSAFLGETLDALVILVIIGLCVVLGFIQEYRAERAALALAQLAAPTAVVIREGREMSIPSREVVPGDLLVLQAGDRVAADARLLSAFNLQVDEALLTGESIPAAKDPAALPAADLPVAEQTCMVFGGTVVTYGRGLGVVTATGPAGEFGRIARLLEEVPEEATPLQLRLAQTGRVLAFICLTVAAAAVLAGLFRGQELWPMLLWGISLAVAAVPEALPAVVTGALALGTTRMARQHAIVKRLPAVETMGCTTVICTDKTGTLTRNQMTVRRLVVDGRRLRVTGSGYAPQGEFLAEDGSPWPEGAAGLQRLAQVAVLCNDAALVEEDGVWQVTGDPTEGALLVLGRKAGLEPRELLEEFPRVAEIPFTSERRRMSTIHRAPEGYLMCLKGAPESLLPWCGRVAAGEGARPLGEEDRRAIAAAARDLAGEGLRVLGLAYRLLPEVPPLTPASEEEDLVWVGLAGLLDPPRPEAQDAVQRCRRAGIRVLMVTGDHPDTALAVAREVGLVAAGGPWPPVLTGSELNALQDEELLARLDSVRIFARVSPEHKLRLVHLLKRRGEVVAMTGDGVNDAPALKRADIGVAMGLSGTEVTKETAALILADDNFATLVAAVEEGRAIYDNIKKYLLYLLSCNFSEVLVLTLAVFLGLPLPLIALQILWVNLTTDGLPALALGVDPKAPDLMDRPPRPPGEGVFTPQIKVLLLAISLHLTLVLLPLFAWYVQTDPNRLGSPELVLRQAQTMVFVTLVLAELLNALNCRDTVHSLLTVGPLANRFLVASLLISLGLLAAVIQWPPLARLFHTLPLDLDDWLVALGLAFTIIPMVELVKWLRRSGRAHP